MRNQINSNDAAITLNVLDADGSGEDTRDARVGPTDLERLGTSLGEFIAITGRRTTVARVFRTAVNDTESGIIYLAQALRANAGLRLGDPASVAKIVPKPARQIILLSDHAGNGSQDIGPEVLRQLRGSAVVTGDRLRLQHQRFSSAPVTVGQTVPTGAVMVEADTELVVEASKDGAATARTSYSDIGGLSAVMQQIKEVVELPLKYPKLFEHLGIGAPKGVLLQGPPGCGKTLIARAVAAETSAHFLQISGPEIVHRYYGDSEAHLREVFQEARAHAPSIIFLDELDAIAPKRQDVYGEMEKRIVAQLMALMDGLEARGQVVVLAATNIPDSIDPALRRPGRFDREIHVPVPDAAGRREILEIHTRPMPLSTDVDLDGLAQVTYGYVGADIEALCREAAMRVLRRSFPSWESRPPAEAGEDMSTLLVTHGDFLDALAGFRPSTGRGIFSEASAARWEELGGLEETKQRLLEAVEWPLRHQDLFLHFHTAPPSGVLLYGPPGTGKTSLVQALANRTGVNLIHIKGPALLSKWVGESEQSIREVFLRAKLAAPCILFFDEIDALAPTRNGHSSDTQVTDRMVSQLLGEMDGLRETQGIIAIAATARPDLLDPALLSSGRFESLIPLQLPDRDDRLAILRIQTRSQPLARTVDLQVLADLTEGFAGAGLAALCRRAALLVMRDYVSGRTRAQSLNRMRIAARHFREALREVRDGNTPAREDKDGA